MKSNRRAYLNALVIAPQQGLNGTGGLLIEDGWILAAGPQVTRDMVGAATQTTDCKGKLLMPGLIDMRVFTGEQKAVYELVLAALDQTVVSTALPAIARDLHGLDRLSWVFSAYLLAAKCSGTAPKGIEQELDDAFLAAAEPTMIAHVTMRTLL